LSQPNPRTTVVLLGVFLLFLGIFPLFAQEKTGGTLVIAQPQEALALDPALIQDMDSARVSVNIFETLLKFAPNSEQIVPGLATSWDSFEEGRIWVFRLRKGVYFQDGTKFDGQSVKFNLERQGFPVYSPYSSSSQVFSLWGALFNGFPGWIRNIDLLDQYTVKIVLTRPLSYFPRCLALPQFGMISPASARKYAGKVYLNPVGTGPFKFKEWRKGQRVVLEANEKYWEGKPYLKQLIFQAVSGEEARTRQLLRENAQLAYDLSYSSLNEIRKNRQFTTAPYPLPNLYFLAMNFRRSPLNYELVRRALNYGINKRQIRDEVFSHQATIPNSVIHIQSLGHNADISRYRYNPYRAYRLLSLAGYSGGITLNLLMPQTDNEGFSDVWKLARSIEKNLRQIGVRVKLVAKNQTEYLADLRTGNYDLALASWRGIRKINDDQLYYLFGRKGQIKGKAAYFGNARIEELFNTAWANPNLEYRNRLYQKLEKILYEESALIPLAYSKLYYGKIANLKGLYFYANTYLIFKDAYYLGSSQ